jgi:hypothetical protein
MGGTYLDANLSTVAGRDLELHAVAERYDAGWMDMWRTDTFTAPENPLYSARFSAGIYTR